MAPPISAEPFIHKYNLIIFFEKNLKTVVIQLIGDK